jgi:hypothetical protein
MADDDVLSPLTIKDQKRPTQLLKLLMALGAIPLFVQMQERALSKDNVEKFLLPPSAAAAIRKHFIISFGLQDVYKINCQALQCIIIFSSELLFLV